MDIRIRDITETLSFSGVFSNGIPCAREIVIENLSEKSHSLEINLSFTDPRVRHDVQFENPNSDYFLKSKTQLPVFSSSWRPNKLFSDMFRASELSMEPKSSVKLLIFVSITQTEGVIGSGASTSNKMNGFQIAHGELTVTSTSPAIDAKPHKLIVPLSVSYCDPLINTSIDSLLFKNCEIDHSYQQEFSINNLCPLPLCVSIYRLAQSSSELLLTLKDSGGIVGSSPYLIDAYGVLSITAHFTPKSSGQFLEVLRITNESLRSSHFPLRVFAITSEQSICKDILLFESRDRRIPIDTISFAKCYSGITYKKSVYIYNTNDSDVMVKMESSNEISLSVKEDTSYTMYSVPNFSFLTDSAAFDDSPRGKVGVGSSTSSSSNGQMVSLTHQDNPKLYNSAVLTTNTMSAATNTHTVPGAEESNGVNEVLTSSNNSTSDVTTNLPRVDVHPHLSTPTTGLSDSTTASLEMTANLPNMSETDSSPSQSTESANPKNQTPMTDVPPMDSPYVNTPNNGNSSSSTSGDGNSNRNTDHPTSPDRVYVKERYVDEVKISSQSLCQVNIHYTPPSIPTSETNHSSNMNDSVSPSIEGGNSLQESDAAVNSQSETESSSSMIRNTSIPHLSDMVPDVRVNQLCYTGVQSVFTIMFHVSGQKRLGSVPFVGTSRVYESVIHVEDSMDFGDCVVGKKYSQELVIRNMSNIEGRVSISKHHPDICMESTGQPVKSSMDIECESFTIPLSNTLSSEADTNIKLVSNTSSTPQGTNSPMITRLNSLSHSVANISRDIGFQSIIVSIAPLSVTRVPITLSPKRPNPSFRANITVQNMCVRDSKKMIVEISAVNLPEEQPVNDMFTATCSSSPENILYFRPICYGGRSLRTVTLHNLQNIPIELEIVSSCDASQLSFYAIRMDDTSTKRTVQLIEGHPGRQSSLINKYDLDTLSKSHRLNTSHINKMSSPNHSLCTQENSEKQQTPVLSGSSTNISPSSSSLTMAVQPLDSTEYELNLSGLTELNISSFPQLSPVSEHGGAMNDTNVQANLLAGSPSSSPSDSSSPTETADEDNTDVSVAVTRDDDTQPQVQSESTTSSPIVSIDSHKRHHHKPKRSRSHSVHVMPSTHSVSGMSLSSSQVLGVTEPIFIGSPGRKVERVLTNLPPTVVGSAKQHTLDSLQFNLPKVSSGHDLSSSECLSSHPIVHTLSTVYSESSALPSGTQKEDVQCLLHRSATEALIAKHKDISRSMSMRSLHTAHIKSMGTYGKERIEENSPLMGSMTVPLPVTVSPIVYEAVVNDVDEMNEPMKSNVGFWNKKSVASLAAVLSQEKYSGEVIVDLTDVSSIERLFHDSKIPISIQNYAILRNSVIASLRQFFSVSPIISPLSSTADTSFMSPGSSPRDDHLSPTPVDTVGLSLEKVRSIGQSSATPMSPGRVGLSQSNNRVNGEWSEKPGAPSSVVKSSERVMYRFKVNSSETVILYVLFSPVLRVCEADDNKLHRIREQFHIRSSMPLLTRGDSKLNPNQGVVVDYLPVEGPVENRKGLYSKTIEIIAQVASVTLDTAQLNLHFGKLVTKFKYDKLIRIYNNSAIDCPVYVEQQIVSCADTPSVSQIIIPAFDERKINISLTPSLEGNLTGKVIVHNVLNPQRSLRFNIKAVASYEAVFRILTPITTDLGPHLMGEHITGSIRIRNTSAREIPYKISVAHVSVAIDGQFVTDSVFQPLICIRRAGSTGNRLSGVEREQLERRKEKILRDIRVCKRKGRHSAQERLDRKLKHTMSLLAEEMGEPIDQSRIQPLFEENRRVVVLVEPDYTTNLDVDMYIREVGGWLPVVGELQIKVSISIMSNITNKQEVYFLSRIRSVENDCSDIQLHAQPSSISVPLSVSTNSSGMDEEVLSPITNPLIINPNYNTQPLTLTLTSLIDDPFTVVLLKSQLFSFFSLTTPNSAANAAETTTLTLTHQHTLPPFDSIGFSMVTSPSEGMESVDRVYLSKNESTTISVGIDTKSVLDHTVSKDHTVYLPSVVNATPFPAGFIHICPLLDPCRVLRIPFSIMPLCSYLCIDHESIEMQYTVKRKNDKLKDYSIVLTNHRSVESVISITFPDFIQPIGVKKSIIMSPNSQHSVCYRLHRQFMTSKVESQMKTAQVNYNGRETTESVAQELMLPKPETKREISGRIEFLSTSFKNDRCSASIRVRILEDIKTQVTLHPRQKYSKFSSARRMGGKKLKDV